MRYVSEESEAKFWQFLADRGLVITRRASESPVGQRLPWSVAALLVLVGSGFTAMWLNGTATEADRDRLDRGADAVRSNVEEQVRILELVGSGAQSLSGQSTDGIDLSQMATQVDITVLSSLLAVISYPIDQDGAGPGEALLLEMQTATLPPGFEVPEIDLSRAEFDELRSNGQAFFSAPFSIGESDRLDYVAAMPVETGDGLGLVGVAFRPDRMLASAVEAAGAGQYAVELIDVRYEDLLVVSLGEASSEMQARREPDGVKTALELRVRPGAEFRSAGSPWISVLVVGTGLLIALLLTWMGRMARARSEELTERLRLAQELNESKDRFLATVSHELRTPLTVVLGVASEVGPNWGRFSDTDREELMTMMTEQAAEAANIVEDLLVAARSDPSQLRLAMSDTHLLAHLQYALTSLPVGGQHRVVSHAHDHPVYADGTRLRQILRNLLENAVRYGGDEIAIECSVTGNSLQIDIVDNGESLVELDLKKIFEPYEQSGRAGDESPSGVGIGLYVSRLLAQLMGGDLLCVRENGLTKFRLTLAVTEPGLQPVGHVAAAASG